MSYKVLIIEDEKDIREVVGKYLEKEGYEILQAQDGFEGLALFGERRPNLVILDIMMPGIDGFDVLKELRRVSDVPVIMLTAKQEEEDRLRGFDLGVDDYVSKPFSPRELVKRVGAVLKRVYGQVGQGEVLIVGDLRLDVKRQRLYRNDEEIEVTAKEFMLLKVFFMNPGQLLSREQLIEDAFGVDYDGFDRNIDSYIKKIRQKIEKNTRKPEYLKTKYGAGYVFGGDQHDH